MKQISTCSAQKTCLICDVEPLDQPIAFVCDHEYENSTELAFPVVQCPNCKLIWLLPRPSESELSTIYPPNYFAHTMQTSNGRNGSWISRHIYKRNLAKFASRLGPSVNLNNSERKLRIIDIGSGTGRNLEMLSDLFPNAEIHGLDMSSDAIQVIRDKGYIGHLGRLDTVDLPEQYFDLVISIHVIEHVAKPDIFLDNCNKLINDTGYVYLETPNTNSVSFRLFKKHHWGGYHAPRHWYIFNQDNIGRLAERSGMTAQDTGVYPVAVFPLWTMHSIMLKYFGRYIADFMFPPVDFAKGTLYPTFLLIVFSVFQGISMKMTGKASALWISFQRNKDV